ncbi:MAG: 23S rRNA (adenine(2503)-C(2))-methyltransferase RlmN [Bacteroidales bacterium]
MVKERLFGKVPEEVAEICRELEMPGYAAAQIVDWLYKKRILSIDDMTNLAVRYRDQLKEKYEVRLYPPSKVEVSADGTKKYLYQSGNKKFVESAYIPDGDRATLCVSSQVGCKMGCLFCMTGKQGFQGNLTAGEIVNQIHSLPERDQLTSVVYMGMGEPFDNLENVLRSIEILTAEWGYAWSPRRITVSTIGIIPAMQAFLERSQANLAVSLHTPFEEERKMLMPVEQVYPLPEVLKTVRSWDFGRQRRISFEYILFKNLNDTPRHVKELARLLNGLRCRINLIRFHPIPDTPLEASDDQAVQVFKDALNQKGILTTIRASRGEDIWAACGLLSTREMTRK